MARDADRPGADQPPAPSDPWHDGVPGAPGRALVIGAGPAGLMAAEVLSGAGVAVVVADQMPSPARKFLMAGRSGLNLTKRDDHFDAAYGRVSPAFSRAIAEFGPDDVVRWATGLGQDVFTGSTGRVFPVAMKASPLLRAWLARLSSRGVRLRTRWRWDGWRAGRAVCDTPDGPREVGADVTVLAVGGASWRNLGSDGAWAAHLPGATVPFRPANVGLRVDWSAHMARWHGQPLKGVAFDAGAATSRGEAVVTPEGLEGGGIYSISSAVRDGASLNVDLVPDLPAAAVAARLAQQDSKHSLATRLRKALNLDGTRAALLNEFGRPFGTDMAGLVKRLPVRHSGVMPLDEAISTAGGLRFDALDGFRLAGHAQVYAAGEMLDWEAPTGGWLITGCLATGRAAALQALAEMDAPRSHGATAG